METWQYVSVIFVRCVAIPLFIFGIVGNLLTIYIFIIVRSYRTTSCTIYLLASSIIATIQMITVTLSRILIMGFNYDLTKISLVWCKSRQFILVTYVFLQLAYECLAIIDQFLVTSRTVRLRQLSHIKSTICIIAIFLIVWHLHGIPFLVYNQIELVKFF